MDKKTMVVGPYLSKEMIEAGVALVQKLDESGFSPCAAFWIYSDDISGIRFTDAAVDGAFIDDAYIYRAQ